VAGDAVALAIVNATLVSRNWSSAPNARQGCLPIGAFGAMSVTLTNAEKHLQTPAKRRYEGFPRL
jgi:hypothetical protein